MADFINTIDVLGDDAVFDSIINRTIMEFKDNIVTKVKYGAFQKCTALSVVELPNVTFVDIYGFHGCTTLKTASIPNVTRVNQYGFSECTNLADLTAPNVTRIDANAFKSCYALKRVVFPVLDYLDASAFASCRGLEFADVGTVNTISSTVFNSCQALKALVIRKTDAVTTLNGNSFNSTPIAEGTGYIYVPAALYDSYKAADRWSTYTNQFRKLEEWTVDGTITGELDLENRHMVRFFNSDGTYLGYDIVTNGGTAVYDGDTPVDSEHDNYTFAGWKPLPTNITTDTDCYAQYDAPYVIEEITDDWATILASVNDGTYRTKYRIGNYKPLDLGAEGVVNMQIVAFDVDELADGSGNAPITWISRELLKTKRRINPTESGTTDGTGSYGGWPVCEMRDYLKNTVRPLIQDLVRNSIKEVNKVSACTNASKNMEDRTSVDDVWIPSVREIRGGTTHEQSGTAYTILYYDDASRVKTTQSGTADYWWLRSGPSNASTTYRGNNWMRVWSNGIANYAEPTENYCVCLGFCT